MLHISIIMFIWQIYILCYSIRSSQENSRGLWATVFA